MTETPQAIPQEVTFKPEASVSQVVRESQEVARHSVNVRAGKAWQNLTQKNELGGYATEKAKAERVLEHFGHIRATPKDTPLKKSVHVTGEAWGDDNWKRDMCLQRTKESDGTYKFSPVDPDKVDPNDPSSFVILDTLAHISPDGEYTFVGKDQALYSLSERDFTDVFIATYGDVLASSAEGAELKQAFEIATKGLCGVDIDEDVQVDIEKAREQSGQITFSLAKAYAERITGEANFDSITSPGDAPKALAEDATEDKKKEHQKLVEKHNQKQEKYEKYKDVTQLLEKIKNGTQPPKPEDLRDLMKSLEPNPYEQLVVDKKAKMAELAQLRAQTSGDVQKQIQEQINATAMELQFAEGAVEGFSDKLLDSLKKTQSGDMGDDILAQNMQEYLKGGRDIQTDLENQYRGQIEKSAKGKEMIEKYDKIKHVLKFGGLMSIYLIMMMAEAGLKDEKSGAGSSSEISKMVMMFLSLERQERAPQQTGQRVGVNGMPIAA